MMICIILVHHVLLVSKYKFENIDIIPSKYLNRDLISCLCQIVLAKETTGLVIR